MRFIHIADVHYGVVPDKGKPWSEKRALEVKTTFKDILDIAEKNAVDLLLIAGDLFHSMPKSTDIKEVDYLLGKLTKTRTIIIAGNHDYITTGSPMATYQFTSKTICLPPDKTSNVYLKDINTCITGYSYGKREITTNVFENIKPVKENAINILLAHGGDEGYIPFDKKELINAGFDYIALGHIHKPEIIEENLMAYSGSIEPIDATDIGKRGYIYGEIGKRKKIVFKQCNKRSYYNLSVEVDGNCTNEMIIDTFDTGINQMGIDNIYRLILRGRKAEDLKIDLRELENKYNIYEVVDNVYNDYDIEHLYEENRDNLIGRYIGTFVDKEESVVNKKALHYGVEAILSSGNK